MLRTEKFDLVIPEANELFLKKELQKICNSKDIYPFRITKVKTGMVVSFLRPSNIPLYLFSGYMFDMINDIKRSLSISTILQKKTLVSVDENNLPKLIKEITESSKSSESDEKMSKNLEEDMPFFDSFVNKQILESDYDTSDGRIADKKASKVKKMINKLIIPENEFGQIAFNINKI